MWPKINFIRYWSSNETMKDHIHEISQYAENTAWYTKCNNTLCWNLKKVFPTNHDMTLIVLDRVHGTLIFFFFPHLPLKSW